nr:cytochrome c oxidase subunit 2 [Puncturella cf. parvinobilis]
MVRSGETNFMDSATPLMGELVHLHDGALVLLVLILSLVAYLTVFFSYNDLCSRFTVSSHHLEVLWTITPPFILLFLLFPSLYLLYMFDDLGVCYLTVKVMGHQWYWSYEYSDFYDVEFDSYMIPSSDLVSGEFRLLEVDHRAVLPAMVNIRFLISSGDVIHSWSVPSLGIKSDAVPGRLNAMGCFVKYPGVYYGQCSEICGANHSFMPIVVEVTERADFCRWVRSV